MNTKKLLMLAVFVLIPFFGHCSIIRGTREDKDVASMLIIESERALSDSSRATGNSLLAEALQDVNDLFDLLKEVQ